MTVEIPSHILELAERLRTQDNRITADPMFCVQVKRRIYGMDTDYCDQTVWLDVDGGDCEEVPEGTEGAEEVGYCDRWETVMVAFTEKACQDYIKSNGHNHSGELRIYAESFYRCDEMIQLRNWLMSIK